MSTRNRFTVILSCIFALTACSSTPPARRLAQDAITVMGGIERLQSIHTLTMSGGTGTRLRLGQMARATDAENPGQLTDVVEIADLTNGRASLDYHLRNGGFMQHRHEILTKLGNKPLGIEIVEPRPVTVTSPDALFSWGTQNSPNFLLRRNAVTIALAAAASAPDSQPAQDKEMDGKMYKFAVGKTSDGQDLGLYFDPATKLLAAYEVMDTESILGDVPALYILSDYKIIDGVHLPHHITIRKDSKDYSDIQFSSMAINDPTADQVFAIPNSAANEAQKAAAADEYSPMKITKVGDRVYHAQGYSHHTLIVEFPEYLALMDVPYTEAQTKVLWQAIQEQFSSKPVRYVAVSHHHFDHIGGLRAAAAMGATMLVEKRQEPIIRPLLDARHTHPQDELDRRRNSNPPQPVGNIEVYEGNKVISEGGQSFGLYPIDGSPHVNPMVLGYVSSARALFEPDLYTPPSTVPGNQAVMNLAKAIKSLSLSVDKMVGGHGGAGSYADFLKAAAAPASSN